MSFDVFGKKEEKVVGLSSDSCVDKRSDEIKQGLEDLKKAVTIADKVEIAKELLTKTDIVKTESVLCQFDDDKWYSEKNFLKKFLEYKNNNSKSCYYGVDCDASILCVVMYTLLDDKLSSSDIKIQYGSKHKYEIISNDAKFKGDTLTSALHLLKLYLGCLWKRIGNDEQLKQIKANKDFYELFNTVSRNGIPVAPTAWESYCYEYSDIIWNAMDEKVKDFLRNYNMFGNYMCIPGNSYRSGDNWISFNVARSNIGKWDTVDTLLAKIYGYYNSKPGNSENLDVSYLEAIFTDKKAELAEETIKWLARFDGWDDFIKKNALQAFVDKTTHKPISLKTGKPVETDEEKNDNTILKNYDAIPKTYDEFIKFFSELSARIEKRNSCIFDVLSSK